MRLTEDELELLCELANAAGREVMEVYAGDFAVWSKDDASPLTQADLRADAVIRTGLEAIFPEIFILSEESVSAGSAVPGFAADRAGAENSEDALGAVSPPETFFLVDPLDGTKEFLKRNDEFTVNIALVHQGRVVAGVVLAPALGEMYYAALGLGAFKQTRVGTDVVTRELCVALYDAVELKVLRVVGSRSHGADLVQDWLAALPVAHSFVAAGSSLKFCRIAEGRADVYPRFGPTSQWDTAAAQCVLEQAGGAVFNAEGESLAYGLDRPLLNQNFVAIGDVSLKTGAVMQFFRS